MRDIISYPISMLGHGIVTVTALPYREIKRKFQHQVKIKLTSYKSLDYVRRRFDLGYIDCFAAKLEIQLPT